MIAPAPFGSKKWEDENPGAAEILNLQRQKEALALALDDCLTWIFNDPQWVYGTFRSREQNEAVREARVTARRVVGENAILYLRQVRR